MQQRLNLLPRAAGEVLLLVDWDNFFISLGTHFGREHMHLEKRFGALMKWVKSNVGELLGGRGWVFAPEHLIVPHQQMCVDHKLWLMTCPKRKLEKPRWNSHKGVMEDEEDTVDETIIEFANMMARHQNVKTICIVTGDGGYADSLGMLKDIGIRIALAAPSICCLRKDKKLINLVDRNWAGRRMMLMLDRVAI